MSQPHSPGFAPASRGGEARTRALVRLVRQVAMLGLRYRWRELQLLGLVSAVAVTGALLLPGGESPRPGTLGPLGSALCFALLVLLANLGLSVLAPTADQYVLPLAALPLALGLTLAGQEAPAPAGQRLLGHAIGLAVVLALTAGLPAPELTWPPAVPQAAAGRLLDGSAALGAPGLHRLADGAITAAWLGAGAGLLAGLPVDLARFGLLALAVGCGRLAGVRARQPLAWLRGAGARRLVPPAALGTAGALLAALTWAAGPAITLVALAGALAPAYVSHGAGATWWLAGSAAAAVLLASLILGRDLDGEAGGAAAAAAALARGGVFGAGLGGRPGVALAPEGDAWRLAALGEAFGLAGLVPALACGGALCIRGVRAGIGQPDVRSRLTAAAISSGVAVQMVVATGANLALWRQTGVLAPFVTGSALPAAADWLTVALLLSFSRARRPARRDRPAHYARLATNDGHTTV